jgi:protein involved in polysaccharide export with SLBB domain
LGLAGCTNKFLDPTQVGRFRPTPAVNVILDSLGVAEEAPLAWENAEEPRPKDIIATQTDHALRSGDVVRVTIYELFQEGIPLVNDFIVSETGKISIPEVGVVHAAGLTETQLEEEIRRILSPGILKNPSVSVILLDSQQRTFSVLGNGIARPGRFLIPRYNYRLTDALATAGGPMQFNVSYVYVAREDATSGVPTLNETGVSPVNETGVPIINEKGVPPVNDTRVPTINVMGRPASPELELVRPGQSEPKTEQIPKPAPSEPKSSTAPAPAPSSRGDIPEPREPAEKFELQREMLDMIAPQANNRQPASKKAIPGVTKIGGDEGVAATDMPYGFRLLVPRTQAAPKVNHPRPQDVVQSPIVLADDARIGTQPSPVQPTGKPKHDWVLRDGQWVRTTTGPGTEMRQELPQQPEQDKGVPGQVEWIYRDGNWVQIRKGDTGAAPLTRVEARGPTLPLKNDEELPAEIEWEQGARTRLLRIPADKLLAGDPRYNVVIKPGDTIYVPVDIIGEVFIMGNVNRTGVINITGRPMTLKMAIAAAGGLGPLAWPKNVEITRRIGKQKEEIVMVDLDKIANGEQPDFFIKPHDLINVGTHPSARWRAVLRNAFRAAYGFGFVYDRNFADADYGKGFELPHWL